MRPSLIRRYPEALFEELHPATVTSIRTAAWLAIAAFTLIALVDPLLVAPGQLGTALVVRAVTVGVLVATLALSYVPRVMARWTFAVATFQCLWCGAAVIARRRRRRPV